MWVKFFILWHKKYIFAFELLQYVKFMKSYILKLLLLMFLFSTLTIYGQSPWFLYEKNGKEALNHFKQKPSAHFKIFPNEDNEFYTQKMFKQPSMNKKQTLPDKQTDFNKANKQYLDSLIINEDTRYIFEYDKNGNLTLVTYYKNDPDLPIWNKKDEYTYDNQENITFVIRYSWDLTTNNFIAYYKYEYKYDNKGNLTLEIHYHWNSETNNWITRHKSEYTYDNNGNLTSEASYYWNDTASNWTGKLKSEFSYDNNNNPISHISYYWNNAINNWSENTKNELTYDNNNNLTLVIDYFWDDETNNWTTHFKSEYTYDNSGNQILFRYYFWYYVINNWRDITKTEYTYDHNGNLTSEIFYHRDLESNNLLYNSKFEGTYDNNSNKTLEIFYWWNFETNNWNARDKCEYTYDHNGNLTLEIHYYWNDEVNNFMEYKKIESTYDNNNNPTLRIIYFWDYKTNTWIIDYKEEYVYNLFYSISDIVFPSRLYDIFLLPETVDYMHNNMPIKIKYSTWSETNWIEVDAITFYWSGNDIRYDLNKVKIYPNPTPGQLTIENGKLKIENVEIFDILGKKQSSHVQIISSSLHLVNISHLLSGIYFVKISTETGEIVRKIVKN